MLKTDDDVGLRIANIHQHLSTNKDIHNKLYTGCVIWKGPFSPSRDVNSKYYVTREQLPDSQTLRSIRGYVGGWGEAKPIL